MAIVKKRQNYIVIICAIFVLWMERKALINSTNLGERILEVAFFVCMTTVLAAVMLFLLKDFWINSIIWKSYAVLFVAQTVAMLPLYMQNFMYGDDLWGFTANYAGSLNDGLYFSRPFIDFLKGGVLNTSFQSIKYFRFYNGAILLLLGCVLFRYIYNQTRKSTLSLCFSVFAVVGCSAIDCIAYASVFPINMSLLAAAISYIIYLEARNAGGKRKTILLAVSFLSLFTAFCMYQIGTPIVFFMYIVNEKYSQKTEKKSFTQAFIYMIYYASVAITYLLATRLFQTICGIEAGQSGRSEFIHSFGQIWDKVVWFVSAVCPQTVNRVIGLLFGNSLFRENNMFYYCTFKQGVLGGAISGIVIFLILLSIIYTGIKKKSFIYTFIAVMAIPLSFWPFLILPESYSLTYYSIGIILLFIWYTCDGVLTLSKLLNVNMQQRLKKVKSVLVFVIIFCVSVQSNGYAENAWVNYCRDSYEYLANNIASGLVLNPEIRKIAVQGSIGPYAGGREYVLFAVNDILRELGHNPDEFTVAQSDSAYYISIFNDKEEIEMREKLGEERMERLLQFYMHDDLYSRWCYNGQASDKSSLDFLKECFVYTGQIMENSSDVLSISLEGFNLRNSF